MTLADFLTSRDLSLTAFAAQIGVSTETVRRYRDGTRIPEKEIMTTIFTATDGAVSANDFYGQPSDREPAQSGEAA